MAGMDDDMLQALFDQLDLDGDGVLNKSDLKVALANAGVMITADQVMEKLDVNGTGFISYEEFVDGAALFVGNASDMNATDDGNSDADAEFRSVFDICDKDKDGKLSVSELEQAISHCIGRVLDTEEKAQVLKAFGGDKSVCIGVDQFVQMMRMWAGDDAAEESDGELMDEDDENDLRVFDNYDSDSDNARNDGELEEKLASLKEEMKDAQRVTAAVKKTNAKLKEAVRAESQRCSQLQEALEEFKKKAMRSQQQIDRLSQEKASEKAVTARLQRSLSVLESQQGDWVAARQRMQADLATARAKQQELTTRLHEEFSGETAAINRLKSKLRTWEARSKEWAREQEQAQNEIRTLQTSVKTAEQAKAKCAQLESEKRKLQAELEDAKAKAAASAVRYQNQTQTPSTFRSRIDSSPTFNSLLGGEPDPESEEDDLPVSFAADLGADDSVEAEDGVEDMDEACMGSLAAELGMEESEDSDDNAAEKEAASTTVDPSLIDTNTNQSTAPAPAAATTTVTDPEGVKTATSTTVTSAAGSTVADVTTGTSTASAPAGATATVTDNSASAQREAELQQELDDMVRANAELSANTEAMRMEVEDLIEEKAQLLDEKNRALEAKAAAEDRLKEAEDNSTTLDEELNAAVKHRQVLSAENKRLMDENVALTNKQTAQQDKLDELSGTNRQMDAELKAKDVEIASCRESIDKLESTIKEMEEVAEAKGQQAMAEAAKATAAVLTETEASPARETKKEQITATETDGETQTAKPPLPVDAKSKPAKESSKPGKEPSKPARVQTSSLSKSTSVNSVMSPLAPAAAEWIQGTKNGRTTWMNIHTGEVTAVPPDVLANDAMAISEIKSPVAEARKASSFDDSGSGSASKAPISLARNIGSLPEWAKAAPDIDFSAVIEENFTDGEIGVPANSVELVSVSVNKDDDFVWDVSCRGKLRFHVLHHPIGRRKNSDADSLLDNSAASASASAQKPPADVWVLHQGGERCDRNKGRVRVRAKGFVSLVLDNLGQKRKAHVRYLVEIDHLKVKRELATVAEIAAEKLRKGEMSQMEYDAIMKAEQSYRREKMSSPQHRRASASIEDLALQQLLEGIITQKEYNDIVQRDRVFRMREKIIKDQIYKPDMNKFLGRKGAKLQRRRRALKRRANRMQMAEDSATKKDGISAAFAEERRRYQLFHVEESLNLVTTCKCACNYWEGDYLDPPARKNSALKQAIHRAGGDPNEVILFASVVKRILPERFLGIGRSGKRALVITSSALYELKSPTSVDILHRIELSSIKCVSLSTFVNSAFALIVPDKFDFLFDTPRRAEIVGRLMELYESVEWRPIRIDFMHSIPLKIENGRNKSAVYDERKGEVKLIDQ